MMIIKKNLVSTMVLFIFTSMNTASAAEHEVAQKDKKFSVTEMKIKVGDTVSFPNNDPFYHNIFSLSETKSFDLGSYEQGQTKKVTFDKPGVVDIECAIHPKMQMKIIVE